MSSKTIESPSLDATITGTLLCNDEVVQYRGIKYASIPKRFSAPSTLDSFGGQNLDCTKMPPISPQQPLHDFERVFLAIPESEDVPQLEEWKQDEFECANLILNVPLKAQGAKLPVLVWIHGGAFIFGSANRRSEDLACLVAHSARIGNPIIGVSFNFRHHVVGFSAIQSVGNFGLRDQRIGIEWVKKHVADFGGDPDHVTLAGNSSGAVSVHSHLCTAAEGLFQRAIMFSSTLGTMPPRTTEQQRHHTRALCKRLAIPLDGTGQWEEALRTIPLESLIKAYVSVGTHALYPTLDDGFYHNHSLNELFEKVPPWCEALMVGGNKNEGSLWRWAICSFSKEKIVSLIQGSMPPHAADSVLSAYRIGCASDSDEDTQSKALDFINDGMFFIPLTDMIASWKRHSKEIYEFLLDEPQPYIPEWGATHDSVLLYALGPFDLSELRVKTCGSVQLQFQNKMIAFVYGESPWDPKKRFAFGPSGMCQVIEEEDYSLRRRLGHCKILKELKPIHIQLAMDALIRGALRHSISLVNGTKL